MLLIMLLLMTEACNKQKRDSITIQLHPASFAEKQLKDAVKQMNASCPIKAGKRELLEGAEFKDNKWIYYYAVKEDSLVMFDNPIQNEQFAVAMKQSTSEGILGNPSMLTMIEALIKVDAQLVYKYRGTRSGKTIDVCFTSNELKVMKEVMTE